MAAIVFDCDGVLVDSEPASVAAWQAVLADLGLQVEEGEIEGWIGRTDREIAEHYARIAGLESERLLDLATGCLFDSMARDGLPAYDDAVLLLDDVLRRALPVAVATNSNRQRLDAVLAAARLEHLIPLSVASDEVAAPKPAPDVYLAAIGRLGEHAAATVVVEDTPTGVTAALAAGCRVVAVYRGHVARSQLTDAHLVVDQLA